MSLKKLSKRMRLLLQKGKKAAGLEETAAESGGNPVGPSTSNNDKLPTTRFRQSGVYFA